MENFGPSGGVHRCSGRLLKISVLGAALTLGGGCAGLDHDRRYREQVTSWGVDTTLPAPQESPFSTAAVLDRTELVQEVLQRNPTLRAARHAWRAALERYPQVTSLDDPILGLGAAPRSFGSSKVDDAPKFDLSQKLPFPGKLMLRGEVALAKADAAAHDYEAVRLHLATMASVLKADTAPVVRVAVRRDIARLETVPSDGTRVARACLRRRGGSSRFSKQGGRKPRRLFYRLVHRPRYRTSSRLGAPTA